MSGSGNDDVMLEAMARQLEQIDEWDGKTYAEFRPHRALCFWRTRAIMAERELDRTTDVAAAALRKFAERVYELCNEHIVSRQAESDEGISNHGACGDCVVWTLRGEAADHKGDDS